MATRVQPTVKGADLASTDGSQDAHVRIEVIKGERYVMVDVFRSVVKDAAVAHVVSEAFPLSPKGHRDASTFLQELGFEVALKPSP